MKFICFGYMDETQWDEMAEAEQTTLMKVFCLRRRTAEGWTLWGSAQSIRSTTVSERKVTVTDGPYAETKGTWIRS